MKRYNAAAHFFHNRAAERGVCALLHYKEHVRTLFMCCKCGKIECFR